MTRRGWLAVAIVALVALNVWRWWPADAPQKRVAGARHVGLDAQDMRLAVRLPDDAAAPPVARNLFAFRRQAPQPKPRPVSPRPPPATRTQVVEAEPPPKTPEALEMEAARAELAQLKLVGVIVRDAKPSAYFAWGDRTYMVSAGERMARFTVTEITADGARLHDPSTRLDGVIPVLGK